MDKLEEVRRQKEKHKKTQLEQEEIYSSKISSREKEKSEQIFRILINFSFKNDEAFVFFSTTRSV